MRSIKSLEKGLQILEVIANSSNGVRVKDISERIEEPVSNLSLFINSLVNTGFVSRDSNTGKYFISQKITDIAEKIKRAQSSLLKENALDSMKRLKDEFNENVLLATMRGNDIHFIQRIQSDRSIQILHNSDIYYPPHVTAGGKAILAFLPEELLNKYLADGLYHKFTEKSLINPAMLREELEIIKQKGYAVNKGEYEEEVLAVAAPIFNESKVLGSIVVQFPRFRYSEDNLSDFADRIMESTRSVQNRIEAALNH